MNRPDQDVLDVLASGVASLTEDANLFVGPVYEDEIVPVESVFCLATGGPAPFNYLDGSKYPQLHEPTVQVTVRGDARGFVAARDLARECRDALHDNPPYSYIKCRVREAEPLYLGQDEKGAHRFAMNVEMTVEV